MTTMDPAAVRAGWQHGTAAEDEVDQARTHTGAAAGASTGPFAPPLAFAAEQVDGALATASAVLAEFDRNVESCIADFQATDGASAGTFNELGAEQ